MRWFEYHILSTDQEKTTAFVDNAPCAFCGTTNPSSKRPYTFNYWRELDRQRRILSTHIEAKSTTIKENNFPCCSSCNSWLNIVTVIRDISLSFLVVSLVGTIVLACLDYSIRVSASVISLSLVLFLLAKGIIGLFANNKKMHIYYAAYSLARHEAKKRRKNNLIKKNERIKRKLQQSKQRQGF